jgi:phosphatidate cytidylyltransferase
MTEHTLLHDRLRIYDTRKPVALHNLAIRLLTTAVASPIILGVLFFGSPAAWFGLVLCTQLVAAFEVLGMTHPNDRVSRLVGVLLTGVLSAALYCPENDSKILISALLISTTVGALIALVRAEIASGALRVMSSIATPIYIGLLFCTLALIRRDAGDQGPGYVLMTLMFAWLADTGGYAAGRLFGKTKLYPAISPNKTWEGLFGALIGAVCGALLAHFWYLPTIPLLPALLLALCSGLLGQLGDLAESLLKRAVNAKDSGRMVPGHGGLLDRIDALLLVSPAVYLYLLWR